MIRRSDPTSRRKRFPVPVALAALLLALALSFVGAAPRALADEPDADGMLDLAKRIAPAVCPAQSLEALAKSLLEFPRWEYSVDEDGTKIVHVIGFLSRTNNKLVVVRVQHVLDSEAGTLRYHTMDITGITQPKQTYTTLMKRECRK